MDSDLTAVRSEVQTMNKEVMIPPLPKSQVFEESLVARLDQTK